MEIVQVTTCTGPKSVQVATCTKSQLVHNIYINPQCMFNFDPGGHLSIPHWSKLEELWACDQTRVRGLSSGTRLEYCIVGGHA